MLLIVFPGNIWPGFLRLLCKFLYLTSSVCNILIRWGTALKTARCLTGRPGPHVSLSAVGSRRGAAKSWKQPGSGTPYSENELDREVTGIWTSSREQDIFTCRVYAAVVADANASNAKRPSSIVGLWFALNHVNFQKFGAGLVVLHVVSLLSKESALTNACYDKVHLSYASRIPSTSWGCGALQYLYAYGFYGLLYFCGLYICDESETDAANR